MFVYKLGIILAFSAFFASSPILALDSNLVLSSSENVTIERDFRKFKNERKKERLQKKKNKFPPNWA